MSVSFLFRCFNLGLIIGGVISYCYYKMLPLIYRSIEQQKLAYNNRVQAIEKFKNQEENIRLAIHQQALLIKNLEDKIKRWQTFEENKQQHFVGETEKYRQEYEQRSAIQYHTLHEQQLIEQIRPQVIEAMLTSLQGEITLPMQQRYTEDVISFLAKESYGNK